MSLGSLVTSDALFGIDCRLEKRFKPLMMSWNRLSNDIGLVNIRTLVRRYYKRRLRDRASLIIQLSQTPIIGGILGWLFLNEGYAMQTKEKITIFSKHGGSSQYDS